MALQAVARTSPGAAANAGPSVGAPAPLRATPALAAGSLVDGKYEIERLLGEGGMGVVYLARDIHTRTEVVIKAIRSEYAHRAEFRARILDEGRALARIDHQNVVRLNAVVVEPGAMYLVMQFIEGESLEQRIARYAQARTPMPVNEAVRIFRQVSLGVGAAHREGVIHRDIKPANILIRTRDEVAKVTDFGIAKAEEDARAGRGQTKGIIGSLLYMAPEQLKGRRDLDKRVDIYALGLVLYEMLVGTPPFDAPSEFDIMRMHLEAPLPRVSSMRPDVPADLDDLMQRACAKDREQRFASTDDIVAMLDRAVTVQATAPRTTALEPLAQVRQVTAAHPMQWQPPVQAEPEPGGSRRVLVFALLSVLAVLIGAGFGAVYAMGWLGELGPESSNPPRREDLPQSHADDAQPTASAPAASATQASLPALVGLWKSEAGRPYEAVMMGQALEFRVREPSAQQQAQGYVAGEARFKLNPLPGDDQSFAVEDKIRPLPPQQYPYDLASARSTCQEVWSSVNGQPLRAHYDGKRLNVELVKVEPTINNFTIRNGKAVGCVGLGKAKTSKITESLTR